MILPTRVTRRSPALTSVSAALSACDTWRLRNLKIRNGRPNWPDLTWRKNTGPRLSSLMQIATSTNRTLSGTISRVAAHTSTARLRKAPEVENGGIISVGITTPCNCPSPWPGSAGGTWSGIRRTVSGRKRSRSISCEMRGPADQGSAM